LEEEVRNLRIQVLQLTNKLYDMGVKIEKVTKGKKASKNENN